MNTLLLTPLLLLLLLSAVALGTATTATTLYVSTTGNDANPGTQSAPFLTLAHAQAVARTLTPGGNTVTVLVADGVYELENTLALTELDSGVTFAGQNGDKSQAFVFGGSVLTSTWTKAGDVEGFRNNTAASSSAPSGVVWTTKLSGDVPYFMQLWADGKRQTAARSPLQFFSAIDEHSVTVPTKDLPAMPLYNQDDAYLVM